jgi:antirestriction protein
LLGRGLDIYKDSFNYWLSHSRQAIERAFGMLMQRWGIFWRIFRFSFDRWPLVVLVCMKLHNLCIDKSCTIPQRPYAEDLQDGDEWAVHDNTRDDDGLHRVRALGERRRQITAHLEHTGILRPAHANMNSRCN